MTTSKNTGTARTAQIAFTPPNLGDHPVAAGTPRTTDAMKIAFVDGRRPGLDGMPVMPTPTDHVDTKVRYIDGGVLDALARETEPDFDELDGDTGDEIIEEMRSRELQLA